MWASCNVASDAEEHDDVEDEPAPMIGDGEVKDGVDDGDEGSS